MFPAAADFSLNEIKAYRTFTFPVALGDPAHEPHFSVEDAPNWITSRGYQLYLEHSSEDSPGELDPNDIPTGVLKAYRSYILPENHRGHPFFSLENSNAWINPVALKLAWAFAVGELSSAVPCGIFGVKCPGAEVESKQLRLICSLISPWFTPLIRCLRHVLFPTQLTSLHGPVTLHHPPPNPSSKFEDVPAVIPPANPSGSAKGKTKRSASIDKGIKITRQLYVRELIHMTTVPPTFNVPRTSTAILLGRFFDFDVRKLHSQFGRTANNNYQVDPRANVFYSDENGFSSAFNAFDYHQFDEFMLNTNAFEPTGHIQPDNMWAHSSGEERLEPEPMQWTRASQELPHLPIPNFEPTPSPTPPQQQETNSDSPAELDDYVAPQDIDLELSERNIVIGKRQRTKSTRAGGPDIEERAPKRGAQALP
ncbi:hypothetical protein R3P38DRAFT_3211304 [Favolaschia claudopus]|uniref:Uncharacterized protein n=1 Tax=Favolaschia claudopus TaxID=2862362 RepID=A0AAW0AGU8_9AGAR